MKRLTTQAQAEEIAEAVERFPHRLLELARADIFTGDPVFCGIHSWEEVGDGRSYRNTAHVEYAGNARDKRTTVILPVLENCVTIIHEMGHAIDYRIRELTGKWGPRFQPVSEYARRNQREAFAEAFTAWFYSMQHSRSRGHKYFQYDPESRAFFDRLAAGE